MSENIIIRTESALDYTQVHHLLRAAFNQEDEALLVDRLRNSKAFDPSLSLVAVETEDVVGYILFSKIVIGDHRAHRSLALAPVAVLPEYQSKGIGGKLIEEGLARSRELGYESVIVLGHADYYPRFGFKEADNWNITCPFPVPRENFMALSLNPGGLDSVSGEVRYADEFGI